MLLKDFIIETANESKELSRLAQKIYRLYQANPRREYELKDLGAWQEPAVQELTQIVKVKFDSKFDRSLYNPKSKEILISLSTKSDIVSVLVHELQHALDDLKSKGLFRREKGGYMDRQSEVNARFTQAVHDINNALNKVKLKNIDWSDSKVKNSVLRLIQSYLKVYKLTPEQGIDNKRYQKLLSKIYKFVANR